MRNRILPLLLLSILALTASVVSAQVTTSAPDSGDNIGWTPSIAVGADGIPTIAHRDRDNDDLRVVRCGNTTCSDGAESVAVPASDGRTGFSPAVAIGSVGTPIVAYYNIIEADAPDVPEGLHVLACADPGCTDGQRSFYPDITSFGAYGMDMVLGASGNPLIATASNGTRQSRLLVCDDPACAGEDPFVPIAESAVASAAVGVSPSGNPVAAAVAGDFGELGVTILVCGDPSCGSSSTQTFGREALGGAPALNGMVVDAAGVPAMLLHLVPEEGTRSFALLRCGDAACGSATLTQVAAIGEDFYPASGDIALGPDDAPIITYNDPSGNLVVVDCADADCRQRSEGRPDSRGDSQFSSVAVTPAEGLAIAHYDSGAGDLLVVTCEDTRCAVPVSPSAGAIDMSRMRFPPHPDFSAFVGDVGPTHGELADYVVLATDSGFADSLSGAVLTQQGPMLFASPEAIDDATRTEIDRVLGGAGTIYVLGGEAAISAGVTDALSADGYTIERLSGASRFETSVAIAEQARVLFGDTDELALARAFGPAGNPTAAWADSVTGGGWAASSGTPVVLTTSDEVHPAVQTFLDADAPGTVTLLGGTAALSADLDALEGARRVAGATRFDTARQIALQLWDQVEEGPRGYLVLDATDQLGWAAGLPAAGLAADLGAPVLAVGFAPPAPPETLAAVAGCDDHVLLTPVGPVVDAVLADLAAADDEPC